VLDINETGVIALMALPSGPLNKGGNTLIVIVPPNRKV